MLQYSRKHSYRQLAKRRFAGHILFYLRDPEDAKTLFDPKHNNFNSEKSANEVKSAFEIAERLRQDAMAGKPVRVKQYAPHVKEIEKLLTQQLTTQLNLI